MPRVISEVRRFFERHLPPNATVVVAVSGGPDSTALLRAVVQVADDCKLSRIIAAHLNHRLRCDADADAAWVATLVERLAKEAAVPCQFRQRTIEVREVAEERGISLETAARTARYEWLAELAHSEGAQSVAVGHNADDQVETVLHRLLRGAGWRGLSGMRPRRRLSDRVELHRPLLCVRRSEISAFLEEIGQDFREDTSNADLAFTRNRIRHELLPLLRSDYNPAVDDILLRLADHARTQHTLERWWGRWWLRKTELPRAGAALIFRLDRLRRLPPAAHALIFRRVWQREQWPRQEMGRPQWRQISRVIAGEVAAVDLPGRIRVRRQRQVLQLEPLRGCG